MAESKNATSVNLSNMTTLKQGDLVKDNNGKTRKVLGV
jgi:hypothetical protein